MSRLRCHKRKLYRMSTTVRAAVYLRISLYRNGDGLAVDRQRAECLRIVGERGWTLVGEYSDASVSAFRRNVKRPEYDRLVADYQAGRIDAIVCYDLDRFTRQPRQLEDWIEAAEDRGLVLVTANGEADLTQDNVRMFARIKSSVARGEMERKSARQIAKNAQNVELGRPVPGKRRLGFLPGNMLEHPTEAQEVRDLYTSLLNGESIFGLAQKYGRKPVRIRETLTNPAYAGWVVRKGQSFEAAPEVARIVDRETWEAAQTLLRDPARRTSPGNKVAYLASGIARCGVCDARMVKQGPNYLCKGNLGHPTIKQTLLDDAIMHEAFTWLMAQEDTTESGAVRELLASLDALTKRRAAWQEQATWEGADLSAIRTEVAKLGREIEKVQVELDRVRLDVVSGDIVAALRAEFLRLSDDPSFEADAEGWALWETKWSGLPLDAQREIARHLSIRVFNGRGLERVEIEGR